MQDKKISLTSGAFFINVFGSKVGITISSKHFLFRNNSSGTKNFYPAFNAKSLSEYEKYFLPPYGSVSTIKFLTLKVRNQHFSIAWFKTYVDLPKSFFLFWKSTIFHSIQLPFDANVAEKFLNVIWSIVQDWKISLTCGAFFINVFGSKVGITISSKHFLFRNNSSGT